MMVTLQRWVSGFDVRLRSEVRVARVWDENKGNSRGEGEEHFSLPHLDQVICVNPLKWRYFWRYVFLFIQRVKSWLKTLMNMSRSCQTHSCITPFQKKNPFKCAPSHSTSRWARTIPSFWRDVTCIVVMEALVYLTAWGTYICWRKEIRPLLSCLMLW